MIDDILKNLLKEKSRVNSKFLSGHYSSIEFRARCDEIEKIMDDVLEVAKKYYTTDDIQKKIKEYNI